MICHVFSNSAVAPDSRLSQRTNEWSHWETLVYDKLGIKSIRLNNTTFRNKGEICPRRRENNGKGKEGDQKKKYLHKSDTDTDEEESPPPPGNDPFLSQEKEQPGDFISDDQSELGDSIPDDQHEPREDSSSHEHTEPGDFFPYDRYDFHLHRSPTETLYQSETNEEDTPLMENDQKRTWGKHSPPRSQWTNSRKISPWKETQKQRSSRISHWKEIPRKRSTIGFSFP